MYGGEKGRTRARSLSAPARSFRRRPLLPSGETEKRLGRPGLVLALLSCVWLTSPVYAQAGHGAPAHSQPHAAPHTSTAPRSAAHPSSLPAGSGAPPGFGSSTVSHAAFESNESAAPAHGGAQSSPAAARVFNDPRTGPPTERRPLITAQPSAVPGPARSPAGAAGAQSRSGVPNPSLGTQHLGSWLQMHHGESFQSQERSLQNEPGFSVLPHGQQQRLIDRLHQLDAMPPARRERTLQRIENLERLSPERRQAVRNAAQQLQQMPPARKQQLQSAFRSLRDLPPSQRQQRLASPDFQRQYSPGERSILGNLLSVEPYQPQNGGTR